MPSLGLMLSEGHQRCFKCFSQFPVTLQDCPVCSQQALDELETLAAPISSEAAISALSEGQLLLFSDLNQKGNQ